MSQQTDFAFKALNVISWILFIGICIEAGSIIFGMIFTLILRPAGTENLWIEVDLRNLYNYNVSHYITLNMLMIVTAVLKALMFYFIVSILHDKKLNLSKPFNELTGKFISKLAYMALGIGLFSYQGAKFAADLLEQGVKIPDVQHLRLAGADVWIFMGVTLLVIAQLFKRGIEMQRENDLTI